MSGSFRHAVRSWPFLPALLSAACTPTPAPAPPDGAGPEPAIVVPSASSVTTAQPPPVESGVEAPAFSDDWVTFLQTPHPEFSSIEIQPGAPSAQPVPPSCAALHRRYVQAPDLAWFTCAKATTGETWAVVAWIGPLPPEGLFTHGRWRVVVERNGRVQEGPEQEYKIVLASGCTTPPACMVDQHYFGVTPPTVLWLVDLEGDGVSEAFALSFEQLTQAGPTEFAVTLWQLTSHGVALHDLSRSFRVFAAADCDGDHRPEVVYNPYAAHGLGDFRLRFGYLVRSSAEYWSLLGQFDAKGQWVTDGPLARAYAARHCRAAPGDPFSGPPGGWPGALHCAKLWGASSSKLAGLLRAACTSPKSEAAVTACKENRGALERMTKATLPLTLQAADAAAALPKGCFENYE